MIYLIEGLDCSGKKTVGELIKDRLNDRPTKEVIGPLAGNTLRTFDAKLASIQNVAKSSLLHVTRRLIYSIEPCIDGVYLKCTHKYDDIDVLKISSHYRAWARAIVENDTMMMSIMKWLNATHVEYDAATLLTASFQTRLNRHRSDVYSGKTRKREKYRFMNGNSAYFMRWDSTLKEVMKANIKEIQIIDTDEVSAPEAAELIVQHIEARSE